MASIAARIAAGADMSQKIEDLKRAYAAQIQDYMNTNAELFRSEGEADDGRRMGSSRNADTEPQLVQEILIMPARPWWFFGRPGTVEPPSNMPKPPGWTREWQWRHPEGTKPAEPRWFDPKGGEFRWHPPDKHHPDGHWDYNPWHQWNNQWRNVMPPREGPFGLPPVAPEPSGPWIWA